MKRAFGVFLLLLAGAALAHAAANSCVECHSALDGALQRPTALYSDDIHQGRGIGCNGCHGGDPSTDDPEASMNPARGFLGKVSRTAIPKLCARCHGDAAYMRKFDPKERVDQYAQYVTSIHGKRIAEGDTAAATCIDCHSVHNILAVKDPRSPVYPLRLPETCAHCHSDPRHMAKYKIPTNQFAEYRKSVHWEGLEVRGDLSAPSCASCHGNHGATPPGVASVANVCGACHVLMENLFRQSPHEPVFASMGVAGCEVCHGNHSVQKPSTSMLAGADSVCSQCHDQASAGALAAGAMAGLIGKLDGALARSEQILQKAAESGMEVSEALLRQNDGKDALIKARVAVHAFRAAAVEKPVQEGLKIAAETHQAGLAALEERNHRRIGLGVSLVTILITLAGLWLAIRAIEKSPRSEGR